jgi:diguanylate cyclase (GGDEF)-like protein
VTKAQKPKFAANDYVAKSGQVMYVRVDPAGIIVDTNHTFRIQFGKSIVLQSNSLYSLLEIEGEGSPQLCAGLADLPGLPTVFYNPSTDTRYIFHVYDNGAGFDLFGIHQSMPADQGAQMLADLTTNMRNLVRESQRVIKALSLANQRIVELSETDVLTGLANRRKLMEQAEKMLEHARRHQRPLSVVMLDIDHFKLVNDRFGHQVGDQVLEKLGGLLLGSIRAGDIAARYGGEEFILVLAETNLENACQFAERIRVEQQDSLPLGADDPVMVSLGVATSVPNENLEALIARVDKALYAAKNTGRNKVSIGDAALAADDSGDGTVEPPG